ncbi:MAG TPA: cytochrome c peroxidase [Kofleriaceae bacterium]|nr:cytochrome c peroxidase [Kofleriaceae bacterium]
MQSLQIAAVIGISLIACKRERAHQSPPQPAASVPAVGTRTVGPELDVEHVLRTFAPLPSRFDTPANPATPEKIALGRMLYFDPRLSKSQEVSCASCHDLERGGADVGQFSKGHQGKLGDRNSPTVFNAAGQIAQFWDGHAATVEDQAVGPMLNPVEMAMPDPAYATRVLRSIPGYVTAFDKAFPGEKDPFTNDNIGRAIGVFERGLVTPTRFDALLAGKDDALDPAERAGLALFMRTGCTACHQGPLVGGTMYMKLGLLEPYVNTKDQGRFDVTKREEDRMFFKVPSLRNVVDTPPYFHDGSIKDLPTAVNTMARLQLGKQLTNDETASIVTFLRVLTGKPPADYIAKPKLPPSGPRTPKPDRT